MFSILLDTQFFYHRGFSFDHPEFDQLIELVDAGKVEVFITKVIDGEVKANMSRRLSEGHDALRPVLKRHPDLRHFGLSTRELRGDDAREKVVKARHKAWEEFKVNVEVEFIETDDVPVDEILEAYFANTPPFGKADKKAEFPDAITLAAAKEWSVTNGELHVVSNDGDFEKYCEDVAGLIYHDTLAEVLEPFNDEFITKSVQKFLEEQIPEYESFLSDHTDLLNLVAEDEYGDDPDVADIQFTNCELAGQPTIISAEDGTGVAEVEIRFEFTAEVSRPDESSRIYDSEEKRVWYFSHETALVDDSATVTLTVEFTYDEEDPSDVTIVEINPDDETRRIDLGRAIFESDDRDPTE